MNDLQEMRKKRRDQMYAELRNRAPDLYREAAIGASVLAHNHNMSTHTAADVEAYLVGAYLSGLDASHD
jgi:hypothetical protein